MSDEAIEAGCSLCEAIEAGCSLCKAIFEGTTIEDVTKAFDKHNAHAHPPPIECDVCGKLFDGTTLPVQEIQYAIHHGMDHPKKTPTCSKCRNPNHNGTDVCPGCTENHCDVCGQSCDPNQCDYDDVDIYYFLQQLTDDTDIVSPPQPSIVVSVDAPIDSSWGSSKLDPSTFSEFCSKFTQENN
jgi:hypothetical protein